MSGRKQFVPPWTIALDYQERRIRKLRNRLEDVQERNQGLSAELSRAQSRISAVDQRVAQQHEKIRQIDRDVQALKQRDENSREYAENWLALIQQQQQELIGFEMPRFFATRYSEYTGHLANITRNITARQYQAATALAQNWHTTMMHDLPEIQRHFQEGKALEIELADSYEQLTAMMQQTTLPREFDTDQGKVTEAIEIAYWAPQEWAEATRAWQQIEQARTQLEQMDLASLQQLETSINEAVTRINSAGRTAEIRFMNYLRKMATQEDIARKLLDRGFEIKDNIFEGDDTRANNILLMENERGEKILINIGETGDQLNLEVDFSTLDPLTHGQRLEGIMQAVGATGYQTVPGYEHKAAEAAYFDLARYAEKQTQ